jgi:hypothetical protein
VETNIIVKRGVKKKRCEGSDWLARVPKLRRFLS